MLPKTRIRRFVLVVGVTVCMLLLLAAGPLRRETLRVYVLSRPGATPAAMRSLAMSFDDDEQMLAAFWRSSFMSHRLFALEHVAGSLSDEVLRPYLLEAVLDADSDLAMHALHMLCRVNTTDNLPVLATLLRDPDPQLRWRACLGLATRADLRFAGWLIPLLDDPSQQVRMAAMGTLQRWSGIDDGVISQSLAAETEIAGREWLHWWSQQHHADFLPLPPLLPRHPSPAPAATFMDADGRRHALRDYRGKPLVLVFWGEKEIWSHQQLIEARAALLDRTDVHLIAMNVDTVPAIYAGHEADSMVDGVSSLPPVPAKINWSFPEMSADIEGILAYRISDTPVTVIIDEQGRLTRRLSGIYSAASIRAMIDSLSSQP